MPRQSTHLSLIDSVVQVHIRDSVQFSIGTDDQQLKQNIATMFRGFTEQQRNATISMI
jgi:hypothetical protein